MIDLFRAVPFVRRHRGRTVVVKVGGACLARPGERDALARQLALVQAFGARLVVVHGGGPQTDALQRRLGEEPRKVDGRRVTSELGLRALSMATMGLLNGDLVSGLGRHGAPAVGVPGTSAGLLVARRRPPQILGGEVVDFGQVGDLVACDPACLAALLERDLVPVVGPPASDGEGGRLNVNADLAAAELAVALGAAKLLLVTDAPGILAEPADPESLLSALSLAELRELEDVGALTGGMRVKATAIARALEGGVERVHVVSGLEPEALVGELFTTAGTGTLVTREPLAAEPAGEGLEPELAMGESEVAPACSR